MKIQFSLQKSVIFCLPVCIVLSQWMTIGSIRLSWILSGVLFLLILPKLQQLMNQRILLVMSLTVILMPIVNTLLTGAGAFYTNLYISLLTGLVLLLFIVGLRTDRYEAFMNGLIFSCLLFAVWGVYEVYSGNYLVYEHEVFSTKLNQYDLHYPVVAFPNTNDLAQYLVLTFALTAGRLWKKSKVLFGMLLAVVSLCVYHAGSRLSMICLVGFFGFAILLKMYYSRSVTGILGILLAVFGLAAAAIFLEARSGLISRLLENYLVVDTEADYTSGRSSLYINLLKAAAWLPLGKFGTAYAVNDMPPHNMYLFILTDYGWIPAVLFVVLLIVMFLQMWKACKARGSFSAIFAMASLAIFPIMSCVSSTNEQRKVIWVFLGVVIKAYMIEKRNAKAYEELQHENSLRSGKYGPTLRGQCEHSSESDQAAP